MVFFRKPQSVRQLRRQRGKKKFHLYTWNQGRLPM
jgi:hypothetical protein